MSDRIKLNDLRRQYQTLREEVLAALDGVFQEMQLFLGPNTRAFEQEWAQYCGTTHAIGVDNGTDALLLLMRAYDIGPGDEIITPVNTFAAVVEAILEVGATPVFVDHDPATYNLDLAQTAAAITPRTRAIVPAHLYGLAADMDAVNAIARPQGILVLEDASQAQGARFHGRAVGSMSDAAAFSLYYTKNLGAFGEAGIITTSDDNVARRVAMLRQHGADPANRYLHVEAGYNSRLDEVQSAILRIKLRHLEEWNARRRALAAHYDARLTGVVATPARYAPADYLPVHYVYVIRVPERDTVKARLLEAGIETGIHYPVPLHRQPLCAHLGYQPGQFPVAERYANEILSLPMFPELTEAEVDRIADAVVAATADLRHGAVV